MTGILRRIFGRDIKASGTQADGNILVADSSSSGGFSWSNLLIKAGIGRNLLEGVNNIDNASFNIDSTIDPGEYYYGTSTLGTKPDNYGLLKVWREDSTIVYQLVHSAGNKWFSRRRDNLGAWSPWKEYASTEYVDTAVSGVSAVNRVILTGSGTFTVPSGVTQLKVTVVSGGLAGLKWEQGSHGGYNGALYIEPQKGQSTHAVISTSPGSTFSYSAGVGQHLRFFYDPIAGWGYDFQAIHQSQVPMSSTFSGIYADPPIARFSLVHEGLTTSINGLVYDRTFATYVYSPLNKGRLPVGLVIENTTYPYVTSPPTYTFTNSTYPYNTYEYLTFYYTDANVDVTDGQDGYIIVEY